MYTFLVYLVTVVIISGLLYLLFRRPKRDAEFDKYKQTMDDIAKNRDDIPEHTKWNGQVDENLERNSFKFFYLEDVTYNDLEIL